MKKNAIKLNVRADERALIQDLSEDLKEITEGKVGWIYRYCGKEKVGKAIYNDFIDYNKRQTYYKDKGKWESRDVDDKDVMYIFSNDLKYGGILSHTQAFQVIASLIEDFKLTDADYSTEIVESLLTKIIDYVTKDDTLCFDTSPYLHNSTAFKSGEYAYIDSLTWVLSSMLSLFRLHISGKYDASKETLETATKIYKYAVQYLIDSYIDNKASSKKFKKGWNFTRVNKDDSPSLYFTFAVSEVMIDILDTFKNVIRTADITLIHEEIDKRLKDKDTPEAIDSKKAQAELYYENFKKALNNGSEQTQREIELFSIINNGYDVYDENSPYYILEGLVKDSANNIWSIVKNDISDTFYSADLESTISEKAIEQSFSNDALFNSIFIINTIIDAGLDEDADDMVNYFTINGSDEYYEAISNYDTIREALRMAYDNVWQFYTKLKKSNKEYKVSEYTLSFDETFKETKIASIATELRKARIRVFSLMPLLVKTKTTIGEFVISYPQYDMQIYLEAILQNRYVSTTQNGTIWVWEKDGYSTSSNYYFISALSDFYSYYEKYESNVIENATNNEEARKTIQNEAKEAYLIELKTSGEIFKLKAQLKSKEAKIAELEEKYSLLESDTADFRRDPLTYGISKHIEKVMQEKILEVLSADVVGQLLSNLSTQLQDDAVARVQRKAEAVEASKGLEGLSQAPTVDNPWYDNEDSVVGKASVLEKGIGDIGKSLFSEHLLEMAYVDKATPKNGKRPLKVSDPQNELKYSFETLTDDIKKAIRLYVQPIAKAQPSGFVKSHGLNGYKPIDELKAEIKNTEKK